MTTKIKKQLIDDIVTGLAVAALFALVAPDAAFADTLNEAVRTAQNTVAKPFADIVSYISYCMGAVMMVSGIASVKKHSQEPSSEPLNKGLGKIGAGSAFLAAPFVAGMLLDTSKETIGSEGARFTAFEF